MNAVTQRHRRRKSEDEQKWCGVRSKRRELTARAPMPASRVVVSREILTRRVFHSFDGNFYFIRHATKTHPAPTVSCRRTDTIMDYIPKPLPIKSEEFLPRRVQAQRRAQRGEAQGAKRRLRAHRPAPSASTHPLRAQHHVQGLGRLRAAPLPLQPPHERPACPYNYTGKFVSEGSTPSTPTTRSSSGA